MARKSRRAHGGHPSRHAALYSSLDRPLPCQKSLGRHWSLNRPDSRLQKHRMHLLHEVHRHRLLERRPQFLQDAKIPLAAAATCSPTPSTFSTLFYEEEGYAASDIPALVLKHNLHGLEHVPHPTFQTGFALQGTEKSRRFFQVATRLGLTSWNCRRCVLWGVRCAGCLGAPSFFSGELLNKSFAPAGVSIRGGQTRFR